MNEQAGFFDERRPLERSTAPARHTDPQTSKEAAKLPFKRESQRHVLLAQYEAHGDLTDEEAAEEAGIYRGCPWRRCGELREDLMIVPVPGETRISTLGSPQQVCKITGKGRAVLEQLRG